jgi:hypothetical protein
MPDEPSDECPYPKPFPEEFKGCPVYEARLLFPTDSANRPLNPTWTCAHLQATRRSEGGWYGGCGLGDAAARARWLAERGGFGAAVARLRTDTASWSGPLFRRLFTARARGSGTASPELAGIRDALLTGFDLALLRHEAELAAVAVDPAELRDAFRLVVDAFLTGRTSEPIAPKDLVAGFGVAARLFFRPELEHELNPA